MKGESQYKLMAYYYNHRFLVTPVAGYGNRYQEFCNLMKVCSKEKDGDELLSHFLDPDEWKVCLRGVEVIKGEARYKPIITDSYCEFFMWSRYAPSYLALEIAEDLANEFCVNVYKIYGEEDRDEDGAGFVHIKVLGEDEDGVWVDWEYEEYAFFDQNHINFDEMYRIHASDHYVEGKSVLDAFDSKTYAQLTKMLRALAWKKSFKMPERGITSLAASNNMSQMVKVIETIIREQMGINTAEK